MIVVCPDCGNDTFTAQAFGFERYEEGKLVTNQNIFLKCTKCGRIVTNSALSTEWYEKYWKQGGQ